MNVSAKPFDRVADYATLQAALARYGIERNPGPVAEEAGELPA